MVKSWQVCTIHLYEILTLWSNSHIFFEKLGTIIITFGVLMSCEYFVHDPFNLSQWKYRISRGICIKIAKYSKRGLE